MQRWQFVVALVGLSVLITATEVVAAVDMNCRDFTYQQDAQEYFVSRGGSRSNNVDNLDADGDGIACELLPRRPSGSTSDSTSTRSVLPSTDSNDGGLSTGWIVVILAVIAGGVWYYVAEIHGPGNQRAPRSPNATYNTRTMPYESYLQTPEWAAIRQMALDRDGRKCTKCGGTNVLQAHHLSYSRRGHEKLKDLTTLCKRCHEAQHAKRRTRY